MTRPDLSRLRPEGKGALMLALPERVAALEAKLRPKDEPTAAPEEAPAELQAVGSDAWAYL
jgi:hypothetical protein